MRRLAPVLLAACAAPRATAPAPRRAPEPVRTPAAATAVTSAQVPAPARAPAPAVDLVPTLSTPGELFLLVADRGQATCERWQIDPAQHRLLREEGSPARRVERELDFHVAGRHVIFDDTYARYADGDSASTQCSVDLEAHEEPDALAVGGARWFRSEAGCQDALAHHARVAIAPDLGCAPPEMLPRQVTEASRARFERVLARGGTLYAAVDDARCTPVRVVSRTKRGTNHLEGDFDTDVVRDDGMHGVESYGYDLDRGASQVVITGPSTEWRDGSGMAYG